MLLLLQVASGRARLEPRHMLMDPNLGLSEDGQGAPLLPPLPRRRRQRSPSLSMVPALLLPWALATVLVRQLGMPSVEEEPLTGSR